MEVCGAGCNYYGRCVVIMEACCGCGHCRRCIVVGNVAIMEGV